MIDNYCYKVLIIEDNPADFLLVGDLLSQQFVCLQIMEAQTFKQGRDMLLSAAVCFDVILLDITLPDRTGHKLVSDVTALAAQVPVIILTGYSDITFSIESISLGISDYLLKDDLTASSLCKSIRYAIERKRVSTRLEDSERRYSELFHLSPQPMWVYAVDDFRFLDVNKAAIQQYGYTLAEFLTMTTDALLPPAISEVGENGGLDIETKPPGSGSLVHIRKNGDLISVNISGNVIFFKGHNAILVVATDVTEILNHISIVEDQNNRLKEIAWVQSHVVRAPLARIIGFADLYINYNCSASERSEMLAHLFVSADELETVARNICEKVEVF